MNTVLDSDFDLDSMYRYSPASKSSPALSHQALRLPRHDQYEISGLVRLEHLKNYCSRCSARREARRRGVYIDTRRVEHYSNAAMRSCRNF